MDIITTSAVNATTSFFNVENYSLARLLFEKMLSGIYAIAFLCALLQFPALLGENGLLPTPLFLDKVSFSQAPSIFHFYYSDRFFYFTAGLGLFLSLALFFGLFSISNLTSLSSLTNIPNPPKISHIPLSLSIICNMLAWLLLYFLYLSIANVGQDFYSFGWESMLLEAGFFAAFLGPASMKPSWIPFFILYWMLFRVELGAGLIKWRGDQCWRDLTCLLYHHETGPMPNPLSWFFHHSPAALLKGGVAFSHFVQIILPFALLLPIPTSTPSTTFTILTNLRAFAGAMMILHQLLLICGGNYSWLNWITLNWITIALGILTFHNGILNGIFSSFISISPSHSSSLLLNRPLWFEGVLLFIAFFTLILSIRPALNLFSSQQYMNYSWNRYHLIGAYGAFGSVTKKRYEIVISATTSPHITPQTSWQEYEFKGKPGALSRMPPQVAPYHLRLDWLMWFLPFSVQFSQGKMYLPGYETWFVNFIEKLLQADEKTLALLKSNPFPNQKPTFIKAQFYLYQFTTPKERQQNHNWWKRTLIAEYLPVISLQDIGYSP